MPMRLTFLQYSIISVLLFFCVNHFSGFEQDCVLYTLQAMNYIAPERFVGDPAFSFGNQDNFSIFSPLYCLFIKILPIDWAAFIFGALIHLLFAFSAALMVWNWAKYMHCQWLAFPITLLFFALYSYGEIRNEFVFTIKTIEAFPVPRTLSAAVGLLGMAFIFEKKWTVLFLFVLGTLIHPLTAGWCLPLWCFFHFPKIRVYTVLLSIAFPLSIFVGAEPFAAASSSEWIDISFGSGHDRQVLYMAFFLALLLASRKINLPEPLKRITLNLSVVLGIALYWFIVELSIHHIFLHQVQTFRVQWISQIVSTFVTVMYFAQVFIPKIQTKSKLNVWDIIFIVLIVTLWIDCVYVVVSVAFTFLYFKTKNNKKGFAVLKWLSLVICLAGTFFSCFSLLDFHPCVKPEYVYADKLFFLKPLIAATAAVLFCFGNAFCRFQKFIMTFLVLLTCFILYAQTVVPKENFSLAYILGSQLFIVANIQQISEKKYFVYLSLIVFALAVCTIKFYDCREDTRKKRETAMNQFTEVPPFPFILDRGKILFSSSDYGEETPRLRFLSGGYYDYQMKVGSMFSKQHKLETERREWMIYKGFGLPDSLWIKKGNSEKFQMVWKILQNKDSLSNKFQQLCQQDEVEYLISDMILPFTIRDSLILRYRNEHIWLYQCD